MRYHFRGGITNHQFVRPDQRELARAQRRAGTPAEQKAWECLRGKRLLGLKFRRQQVIDGFVVDFFCAALSLVVEVDGGVHLDPDVSEYDRAREVVLRQRGLRIVRIANADVSKATLKMLIDPLLNAESPPLPKGEGEGG